MEPRKSEIEKSCINYRGVLVDDENTVINEKIIKKLIDLNILIDVDYKYPSKGIFKQLKKSYSNRLELSSPCFFMSKVYHLNENLIECMYNELESIITKPSPFTNSIIDYKVFYNIKKEQAKYNSIKDDNLKNQYISDKSLEALEQITDFDEFEKFRRKNKTNDWKNFVKSYIKSSSDSILYFLKSNTSEFIADSSSNIYFHKNSLNKKWRLYKETEELLDIFSKSKKSTFIKENRDSVRKELRQVMFIDCLRSFYGKKEFKEEKIHLYLNYLKADNADEGAKDTLRELVYLSNIDYKKLTNTDLSKKISDITNTNEDNLRKFTPAIKQTFKEWSSNQKKLFKNHEQLRQEIIEDIKLINE